jgi:integral membrane protein
MMSVEAQYGAAGTGARRPVSRGTLLRYRVLALVTAVLLIPLIFVATPLDLFADIHGPAAVLGFVHGWLYVLYLVFAFIIAVQLRLPLGRMLLVLLAGTVPFAGFFAERYVTHAWQRANADLPPAT